MVKLKIDNYDVEVPAGTSILDAARTVQIEIPTLCKHPDVDPSAGCGMCIVRVNGRVAGQHRGGYTGFAVEITDLVDREGENLLTVQLDTREDPAIPPFGFVIDYLTYGGLYREVWLEATAESRLTDLFVYTPTLYDAVVQWTAELTPAAVAVRIRLETADGTLLAEQTAQAAETGKIQLSVPDAQPWDTEHPVLHHAIAELLNAAGQPIDRKQVTFGFRTAEFRACLLYTSPSPRDA